MVIFKDKIFLIEFDGEQHFDFIPFFHKNIEKFNKKQELDIRKTALALSYGYFVIRIAYPDYNDLESILMEILNGPDPKCRLAFSDDDMYDWLLAGVKIKLAQ